MAPVPSAVYHVDLMQLLGGLAFGRDEALRRHQTVELTARPPDRRGSSPPIFAGSEQALAFLDAFALHDALGVQLRLADFPSELLERWERLLDGHDSSIEAELPCAEGQPLPERGLDIRLEASGLVSALVGATVARCCELQSHSATVARSFLEAMNGRGVPGQSASRWSYSATAGAYTARGHMVGGGSRFVMRGVGSESEPLLLSGLAATTGRDEWQVSSVRVVAASTRLGRLEKAGYSPELAKRLHDSGICAIRSDEYFGTHLSAFALDGSEPDLIGADDLLELAVARRAMPDERHLLIDRHYQAIWPLMEPRPIALYGRTHERPISFEFLLPYGTRRPIALFDLAGEGRTEGEGLPEYLKRYRRGPVSRARRATIPKVPIRSEGELRRLVRRVGRGLAGSSRALLFRGQPRHYRVERDVEVRRMLYGADEVDELSMPTTASRADFDYDAFAAHFQLQLQAILYDRLGERRLPAANRPWAGAPLDHCPFEHPELQRRYRAWRARYLDFGWDVAVMGIAQHYGVPTHGLDLTASLRVALFFALHRFDPRRRIFVERSDWREDPEASWPVVYLIATRAPLQKQLDVIAELGLEAVRPARQSALLHYGGWGWHGNVCAQQVVAAGVLAPEFEPGEIPSYHEMFPGPDDDPMYRHLLKLKKRAIEAGLGEGYESIVEYGDP